ncbi:MULTISPECIES: enoyl-CoA hydratase family protein [Rhodococcus]|uniref:Enoyl-CoA hydratase n=1 Tax=Rhodococcoides kyotonense TaxID=398843 RepID=A0A177YBF4_9NOCA|nr:MULTISPECIES: enoyl-CoA hydratase family protein [Rhodococcus]NIL74315.1 putative enoyl-CoA hydratase [Rhodococcus sp. B10]OAK52438.1 enoyl-CoA hydratase [Rhodococcus kyotonensis]
MAVTSSTDNSVTTLTLDSPHNRNALSTILVDELEAGLKAAADDPDVRAIVLTHTGGTFCAGADLSEAGSSVESRTSQMLGLLRLIVETPKPVVGQIDGHVRAGGMGLVAACDIAVAGTAATFALTEARLGLAASIVSLTVLPRLDSRAASRYFLTGEKFGAHEAEAIGLISEASSDPASTVVDILDSLRQASPQGLAESKWLTTRAVLAGFDARGEELSAHSARLFASDEAREGMMSFLQKRPPSWAGVKPTE